MSVGNLTVYAVDTPDPLAPTVYSASVSSTTGVQVGDHLACALSAAANGVWRVSGVVDGTTLELTDDLTEDNGDAARGEPIPGVASWGTPTAGALALTRLGLHAQGWDAALRRNAFLLDPVAP